MRLYWEKPDKHQTKEIEMKFICSIIVVEDIYRSRKLYEDILCQKVISDFGEYNVTYEGGLAFYKKSLYQQLLGDKTIMNRSNNFELYFEVDNLAEIEEVILKQGFEFIHKIKEEPWKQPVFRFYDYDNNNVCIAERMERVSYRLFKENKTISEISQLTGIPEDQILQHLKEFEDIVS